MSGKCGFRVDPVVMVGFSDETRSALESELTAAGSRGGDE